MKQSFFVKILFIIFLLISPFVQAASFFTYEGVLSDADGNPITSAQTVTFRIVYDGSCVLYQEEQNITPGSQGEFSVIVGTGDRVDSTGNPVEKIFSSSGTANCDGLSSATVLSSQRSLQIKVGGSWLSPDVEITSVPYAIESSQISGFKAENLLRVDGGAVSPMTTTQYNKILNLVTGTTGGAVRAGTDATTCSNLLIGAIRYETGALQFCNGTAWTTLTSAPTGLVNDRVIVSSGGAFVESSVTTTKLGYLNNVAADIQDQLNAKVNNSGWSPRATLVTDGAGTVVEVLGTSFGNVLQYTATGPKYTSARYPESTVINQLLYSSSTNTISGVTAMNDGVLLSNGSGIPGWQSKSADNFSQYALLTGRASGQTLNGGTVAGDRLVLDSTSDASKGFIILNPSGGRVSIGTTNPMATLDVNGNVKLGNDPNFSTCSGVTKGQMRYNGTTNLMEYCSGTAWIEIGGRTTCPTGFSLIGTPGSSEAFCISTVAETGKSWEMAHVNCRSKTPKARLCSSAEFVAACLDDGPALGMTGLHKWQWVSEFASNDFNAKDDPLTGGVEGSVHTGEIFPRLMGGVSGQCTSGAHDNSTDLYQSRCCIR